MRTQSAAQENTAFGIKLTSPWRLTKVKVLMDYKLKVHFVDGTYGFVDMQRLIMSKNVGIFSVLKEQKLFEKASLEYGAVTWPGEIDLAPDAMYKAVKKMGTWTPES